MIFNNAFFKNVKIKNFNVEIIESFIDSGIIKIRKINNLHKK